MDDHFFEEEDLVVVTASDRNWKGIIIAIVVIASILALIITSIVLLTPPDEGPRVKGRRFELEDIFGKDFQPFRMNGTWVSDDEYLFRDKYGGVSILDATTLKTRLILTNHTLGRFGTVSFTLSATKKYALFVHNVEKIHRFSFLAQYTVYDIDSTAIIPLEIEVHGNTGHKYTIFELVKWSPVGNSLVLVHQGDIYYKTSPNEKSAHRITNTGKPGVISHGVPDWLYEEEIFGSNIALWFSSDGQNLLYLSFNDSLVGEYHDIEYGNPDGPYQYPKIKSIRYPKSGTKNPIVTATICDLKAGNKFRQRHLRTPENLSPFDHYINAGGWVSNTEVGLVWTTRTYNLSLISICSVMNGFCSEEYRSIAEKGGWVDAMPLPVFSTTPGGKYFITIAPIRDGENGLFDQLILIDVLNKRSHPLTHGTFEVVSVIAWDEHRKLVYFLAIPSEHPNEKHFYKVKVEHPYTEHFPECLSCSFDRGVFTKEIHTPNGTIRETYRSGVVGVEQVWTFPQRNETVLDPLTPTVPSPSVIVRQTPHSSNTSCSYISKIKFSPNKSWFILECGGPSIPYTALYSIGEPPESNVHLKQILQNNDALVNLSSQMAFPQIRIFSVNLSQGMTVQVRLSLPPGLREEEITKYPLILNVYGGPGTQLVVDRWGVDYSTYLASKKEFIVAQIDGRGSGGRGWKYKHNVYYDLGNLEAQDQMEVVKYLRDSLPYVETNKIGIWGWSYGGYLTAHIMTNKDKINLFPCGASIAPVIQWNLYDSAYTERYMGTPNVTDNFKGYSTSDITRNVEPFVENKMFYLIHGTADDNVHIQHSFLLAKALINKKILFRQQVYPDERHSLNGAKVHVHRSIEEFFDDCFKKQILPDIGVGLNKGGKFDDFD